MDALLDAIIYADFFSYFNSNLSYWAKIGVISFTSLIFGSFASLVTYRLTKIGNHQAYLAEKIADESKGSDEKTTEGGSVEVEEVPDLGKNIVFSRSKCPSCGVVLKAINLIPIFSWLFQRGKCSSCKAPISSRYPLIESVFLFFFLLVYLSSGQQMNSQVLLCLAITAIMILMCIYDLEYYYIPNMLQYLLTIAVTMLVIGKGGAPLVMINVKASFVYLACGLALLAFFYVITKTEAIGEDDMKFLFIVGLLFGMKSILMFFMMSGAFGVLFGSAWRRIKNDVTFPFAPAICISAFICLMYGDLDISKFISGALFSQGF